MEENRTSEETQQPAEPEAEKAKLPSFGERLLAIFVEPKVVFDYVARRNDFWLPFIVASVISIIAAALMMPFTREVIALSMQAGGAPASDAMVTGFSIVSVVLAPVTVAAYVLLIALFLWVVMLVLTGNADFGKATSVTMWAYYPLLLAGILNAVVLTIVRPEIPNIQEAQQHLGPIMHYTSLEALFSLDNAIVGGMLAVISLFTIWNLWLLWVGARRSMNATASSATVFVILFLLVKLGNAAFGAWRASRAA